MNDSFSGNKNSRTKNSIINIVTSLGGSVLLIVAQFVCRTVFVKTLGAEYLGINGLFSNILSLLSLTELGLDTAINFKLYKPLKEHNEPRIRALMKFYNLAYIVIGVVILFLGLLLIPFLPVLVNDYDTFAELGLNATFIFLLYLMKSVTSYLFFAYKSAIIKADQKSYITNVVSSVCYILMNLLQILALLLFKDFVIYTCLFIAASIIINLINALIAKNKYKYAFEKSDDRLTAGEIKDIFKDLGALFIFKANGVINKATDNLVLSTFIGLTIVGLYSNYLMFYTTIRDVLDKIYNSIKASMGNLFAEDDLEKKYMFFENMNFITFLLYGTASIGVIVIADEVIIWWLGNNYVIAQPFALLMGIEILVAGLLQNLNQIRTVTGAFRQMWARPLLSILINIVVSIAGVNICGIYGVLIGTIMAGVLTNLAVDPKIIHEVSLKNYRPVSDYYKRNLLYLLVYALIAVADWFVCKMFCTGFGFLSILVHIILVIVTVPTCFMLVFHNRHEAKYVMVLFKRLLFGFRRKFLH